MLVKPSKPSEEGVLGRNLLIQCRVTLDFPNHELLLEPNPAITPSFGDSGITLKQAGNNYYAQEVYPGSPGASAGVCIGELIIKVNGQMLHNLNLLLAQRLVDGLVGVNEVLDVQSSDMRRRLSLQPVPLTKTGFLRCGLRIFQTADGRLNYVNGLLYPSPAQKSGILPGDKIISVDSIEINDQTLRQVDALLDMAKPHLSLTVMHPGAKEPVTLSISLPFAAPISKPVSDAPLQPSPTSAPSPSAKP